MSKASSITWLIPLIILLLLTACATISETGKSALILVSPDEELRLGISSFDQLKQKVPVSRNQQAAEMVKRAGERIALVSGMSGAQWEFILFEDPTPNAFALPGGKVGVNTGILPIAQDEEGLATVMSHEVSHVILRHGAQRMSEGMLMNLGRNVLQMAMYDDEYKTRQMADTAFGVGSAVFLTLPHSRDQELEADRIGLRLMKRAGYNPSAAIGFWKRFAEYNQSRGGGRPPEFLSTHPVDTRRIQQVEELVAKGEF